MPTPIVYGDLLYVLGNGGLFDAYEWKTGTEAYRQRIPHQGRGFSASPVGSDGRIYLSSKDGDMFVVQAGREFKLVATNTTGEPLMRRQPSRTARCTCAGSFIGSRSGNSRTRRSLILSSSWRRGHVCPTTFQTPRAPRRPAAGIAAARVSQRRRSGNVAKSIQSSSTNVCIDSIKILLIVQQAELEHVVAAAGLDARREYVVLGTIDRCTWRRGLVGEARLADIREHMADFKKYLKVDVTPAHWQQSSGNAG